MIKKDPWFRNRLIRDAIYEAIFEEMKNRPEIFILGEGSHMKVHFDAPYIEKEHPEKVITMPISEDANSNFAVGLSLAGIVPIVDVISSDFLYRTMDAICNTMAKSGAVGKARTMIVRAEFLTGGPTSGQRIEALFAHIPGLRVAVPSNPADAYVLMKDALRRPEVTLFFEDRNIEDAKIPELYKKQEDGYPVHAPCRARIAYSHFSFGPAPTVTIVSYGLGVRIAESTPLSDTILIDLRSLYPLDIETILERTEKNQRLLIVEPDSVFMGIGAEIAAQVAERQPGCRIKRLGGPHTTIPASRERHDELFPTPAQITSAVSALRG